MTSSPDLSPAALERRIGELELLIVRIVGVVAIGSLAVGAFLPWFTEESPEDGTATIRLGTLVLGAFAESGDLEPEDVLLAVSFGVLDLTTIAAIVCVALAMAGAWRTWWAGSLVIGLLACCLAGAGLLTLIGAANLADGGSGEMFWSAYLVWSLGALISMWVLTTRLARRPGR